jgi:CRP-like cAMP-binding protein
MDRIVYNLLAAHLGTVREVVTRSLRELEQSGAIKVDRRKIIILNQSILEDRDQRQIN